jgi:leucyl-tRNA synthetase
MRRFNPSEIEPKWQKTWANEKRYEAIDFDERSKFYISCMFPYPSAAGMHAGHAMEHSIVDATARFQRAHGKNVMNPMGWDSFGLPAENYAIKTGTAPAVVTKENITNFKHQLTRLGASLDWSREVNTSDPDYYKWTQWVFTEFFKCGLAYQNTANQWWCPVDKTVLANEQVEGGKCWRCGSEVEKKSMKQWFFKITDYADALLDEIPDLDWPEKIKTAQKNWIGRSEGAEIDFKVEHNDEAITVFSTRPDTLFGATFLVLAPEHPLVKNIVESEQKDAVDTYVSTALKRSEIERMSEGKEKTGIFTGAYAINPINDEKIPIWVADYVLGGYGTGAVMAVPAHDERDNEFASKYDLNIISVIETPNNFVDTCYHGEGKLINSGKFNGTPSNEAREKIVSALEEQNAARAKTTYKMRDWLISRQRYWGAPIPVIHCQKDGAVAVPEKDLPVVLPVVEDYEPKGQSVLASQTDWVKTTCPECGGPAERETDTMDGYACSSWYLLRYTDPKNAEAAWDPKNAEYWTPVDNYVGGDHAVAHLLYVRFWSHVFYDMKLVPQKEPVKKLVYHGLIQAEDGRKMSKSLGNVIDPLDIIDQGYGADTLRTYLLFVGPIEDNSAWSANGIAGVYRFLNRVWTIVQEYLEAETQSKLQTDTEVRTIQHKTIKKVTNDYRKLSFNTAIAGLMEYTNDLYKLKTKGFSEAVWKGALESLVQLVAPVAPHTAAELWQQLGNQTSLDTAQWPVWDDTLTTSDSITLVVQVNGKVRAELKASRDICKEDAIALALVHEKIVITLGDKKPTKTIYVPGRLVNIVVS